MKTRRSIERVVWIALVLLGVVAVIIAAANICASEKDKFDLAIKGVGGVIVAVSASVAALTYFRNGDLERAKWLNQLHEKFFEKKTYIRIRKALDYNSTPEEKYVLLKKAIEEKSNEVENLQEAFVNYLNFFEYVATLWETGQIKTAEVNMLFGYYLNNLKRHDWVMDFVKKKDNDFKNLSALIDAVNKEKEKNNKK